MMKRLKRPLKHCWAVLAGHDSYVEEWGGQITNTTEEYLSSMLLLGLKVNGEKVLSALS